MFLFTEKSIYPVYGIGAYINIIFAQIISGIVFKLNLIGIEYLVMVLKIA